MFGRAGQLEGNAMDDDIQESEDEDDEEEEDIPTTPRKKRISGLVRLTGKPKTSTPKKARATKNVREKKETPNVVSVDATDDDATPKPVSKRKPRGRPKKNAKTVDSTSEVSRPAASRSAKDTGGGTLMIVPDSAGEANDVWIISSDDD